MKAKKVIPNDSNILFIENVFPERTRRLLDRIIISDVPAGELLKLKIEQVKKQKQLEMDELFETQLVSCIRVV